MPVPATAISRRPAGAAVRDRDGRAVRDLLAQPRDDRGWAAERWPRGDDEPEPAWRRSIRAKALDLLRGLLPAATLSHVGIFASGQAYEQMLLRLMASPLPEAREFGSMILTELQKVMPSFVARVERPDRGGEWISYLERAAMRPSAGWDAGADRRAPDDAPAVELVHVDGSEEDLLASCLFESSQVPETEIRARLDVLDADERAQLLNDLVGERRNRRHRPGRGFEALRYRFEIVSDYGGFRDLQRHRMLTCQWQRLTPDLGAGVPEEVREAGLGDEYQRALEISPTEFERLEEAGLRDAAPYALCLGYRIRYVLDLNAREAMHLIELRSGREGHPTYRAVAHAMHERIASVHPAVAAAMTHVDHSQEPRLERVLSEIRTHRKRLEPAPTLTPRRASAASAEPRVEPSPDCFRNTVREWRDVFQAWEDCAHWRSRSRSPPYCWLRPGSPPRRQRTSDPVGADQLSRPSRRRPRSGARPRRARRRSRPRVTSAAPSDPTHPPTAVTVSTRRRLGLQIGLDRRLRLHPRLDHREHR